MPESATLASARAHLARAEAEFRSADGLAHLQEGLALLEKVIVDGAARDRTVAANLLDRYAEKICAAVGRTVTGDRALAEPDLEHLFRILLAFDAPDVDLPEFVRVLKIDVAKRLVGLYYEGYSDDDKRKALAQLAGIADGEQ